MLAWTALSMIQASCDILFNEAKLLSREKWVEEKKEEEETWKKKTEMEV